MNAIAHLPVSEAYMLPRYPINPSTTEPAYESLGRAYGQVALTLFIALVMSVLFVFAIARLSGEPFEQHAATAPVTAVDQVTPAVPTPTPALR